MDKQLVKEADLLPQARKAIEELHFYMVPICMQNGGIGSGVLINTCGLYGILTAHHVVKALMKSESFNLCIVSYPHSLSVKNEQVEYLVLGETNDEKPSEGPDLAFIIIHDISLLTTIKSKKSFSFLDSQDLTIFQKPLENLLWGVVGSPFHDRIIDEAKRQIGLYSFSGMARFVHKSEHDGFDFMQVKMPCDGENYPANFEGLSGGGIWAITFKAAHGKNSSDVESVEHSRPVLAGISFYQSFPEKEWRTITGHAFMSVYRNLKEVLNRRRSAPAS